MPGQNSVLKNSDTGQHVTEERIAREERELALLSVLRIQNGGSPRNDAILLAGDHQDIGHTFPA